MLRKPLILLFAAAMVVALAACGGDSGGSLTAPKASSSGGAASTAASGGGASDTSGGGAADTSGSGSTDTTVKFSGSGSAAFCGQAQDFEKVFSNSDFSNSSDPSTIKKNFQQAQDALKQLEKTAPSEIKADVKTVSDAMDSLISVFESANYDFTKLAQDPSALAKLQSFDSGDVTAASNRVEAYLTQVCGLTAPTTG